MLNASGSHLRDLRILDQTQVERAGRRSRRQQGMRCTAPEDIFIRLVRPFGLKSKNQRIQKSNYSTRIQATPSVKELGG